MKNYFWILYVILCSNGLKAVAQQREAMASYTWQDTAFHLLRTDSFYYDSADNLIGLTIFGAAHNGTVFLELQRLSYVNDPQGRPIEMYHTRPGGSGHDTIQKMAYQYFPNGKLRLIDENRRDNTGSWSLSPTRTFYEYTPAGEVDSIIHYAFNAGNWSLSSIQTYHYLPNGKLSEIKSSIFSNGSVILMMRAVYTYDNFDRRTLIEIFEGPSEPVLRETRAYFYTSSSELADSLITTNLRPSIPTAEKLVYHYLPNDSLVDTYRYIRNLGQWSPLNWFKLTYHAVSSQIVDVGALQTKVFPNPATDNLYLQLEEFLPARCTVRNISGQLMLETALPPGQNQLNIATLAPGIYWLQLDSGRKTAIHKIVKQ